MECCGALQAPAIDQEPLKTPPVKETERWNRVMNVMKKSTAQLRQFLARQPSSRVVRGRVMHGEGPWQAAECVGCGGRARRATVRLVGPAWGSTGDDDRQRMFRPEVPPSRTSLIWALRDPLRENAWCARSRRDRRARPALREVGPRLPPPQARNGGLQAMSPPPARASVARWPSNLSPSPHRKAPRGISPQSVRGQNGRARPGDAAGRKGQS